MTSFKQFDFNHEGKLYRAELHRDEDMGAPWKEHDGHGVYHGHRYDKAASIARALSECWGFCDAEMAQLKLELDGRTPTAQQIAEHAAKLDHRRMRAWINGDWFWAGIVVYQLDDEYNRVGPPAQSLWGIESDSEFDYFKSSAIELASQI